MQIFKILDELKTAQVQICLVQTSLKFVHGELSLIFNYYVFLSFLSSRFTILPLVASFQNLFKIEVKTNSKIKPKLLTRNQIMSYAK